MAFLIDARHLLTCAHVIRDAKWETESPIETSIPLLIETETVKRQAKIAFISAGHPESEDGGIIDDICILKLDAPVASFDPEYFPLVLRKGFEDLRVRTLGVPSGSQKSGRPLVAVAMERDLYHRVFLNSENPGQSVLPGFSGAPVIAHGSNEVVGMMVARQKTGALSFMLPVDLIVKTVRAVKPTFTFVVTNEIERNYRHVRALRQYATQFMRSHVRTLTIPTQIAFCPSYDRLTAIHRGADINEAGVFASDLLKHGSDLRIYIQAPGGGGKTAFLMQLILAAIDEYCIPFYLDVKNAGKISAADVSLEALFRGCTQPGATYSTFATAEKDTTYRRMLIVDGVNENPESMQRVRDILDEASHTCVNLEIVASDRLSGSAGMPVDFQRATILPIDLMTVSDPQVSDILSRVRSARFRKLLTIPFFFDLYLSLYLSKETRKDIQHVRGRAGILRMYFETHIRISEGGTPIGTDVSDAIKVLAQHAYGAYANPDQGLRLSRSALEGELKSGQEIVKRLLVAGVLLCDEPSNDVYLRHQLLHDFLVAEYLRNVGSRKWRIRIFDVASFGASSFEVLEMASELLGVQADDFIVEVYDWNYTAALECVLNLEAGSTGEMSPVSPALRDALFAMLAEKRFDYFRHTREKANRKTAQFSAQFSIDYAAMTSRESLVLEVEKQFRSQSPMLIRWLQLFKAGVAPEPTDWSVLQDVPLLAWTAANSFRRFAQENRHGFVGYLCQLYRSLRAAQLAGDRALVTRWRIMHVLGTADNPMAIAAMFTAIEDPVEHQWVRYGAVRSLAEAASRSRNVKDARAMLARLIASMPALRNIAAFQEIRDVAIIAAKQPEWWSAEYSKVLKAGIRILDEERKRIPSEGAGIARLKDNIETWRDQLRKLTEDSNSLSGAMAVNRYD